MMEQLKPCPFCGGKAFFLVRNEYEQSPKSGATANEAIAYKLFCLDCFCGTPWKMSKPGAIEAWNRRATDVDNH